MATTTIIPLHVAKGRPVAKALRISVDYIKNPDKTNDGQWVTSYECDPLIADEEFSFSKRQYAQITGRDQGSRDVIGYHLRISFKPGETDAATANRIGYDLAMKLTKGNHAFVCCTHVDKVHIHSHIVINSTSLDYLRKFRNFKGSAFTIRRIADHLCLENGLSVVENPKPSRGSYATWQGDNKPPSNRGKLEGMIDAALESVKDFDAFIAALILAGCEVKRGKYLSIKIPGAERFARCKSLGADYTEEAILERLSGRRIVSPKPKPLSPAVSEYKPNLLIDIQSKMQEGKGEGYRHWATIFNIKEMSKTLLFLKENGLDDYDALAKRSNAVCIEYNERLAGIKNAEKRMAEITELQKHIGTYGKTRDIYAKYKASGWNQDFFDIHATEIILHKAAKKHFDELGYGKGKKLPSINSLKQEYAVLLAEKKKLYSGWQELKENRKSVLTAKSNADRILNGPQPKQSRRDAR